VIQKKEEREEKGDIMVERIKHDKGSLRIVEIYVNGDMEKKLEELKEWMEEREEGVKTITQAHKKKSYLCWSTDHTYPLYFEPLNTNLTSILSQHVRDFFNTKKLLDLSIAYPAHLNQTLNVIQHRNFNLTTLWNSSFGHISLRNIRKTP